MKTGTGTGTGMRTIIRADHLEDDPEDSSADLIELDADDINPDRVSSSSRTSSSSSSSTDSPPSSDLVVRVSGREKTMGYLAEQEVYGLDGGVIGNAEKPPVAGTEIESREKKHANETVGVGGSRAAARAIRKCIIMGCLIVLFSSSVQQAHSDLAIVFAGGIAIAIP